MSKKPRCFLKKFTQLTKILHDCRSRRSRQIPSLLMKLKTQRKAENERRKCSLRRTLPSKARIHISCCSYFILIILLPHFLSCCSYYPTFWVIFKQFWCSVKTNMWTSSWISFSSLQARPLQFHPQLQQVWLLVMIDTNADINTNKMIKIQTDRNADEMIKIEMSTDIMTMILLCIWI